MAEEILECFGMCIRVFTVAREEGEEAVGVVHVGELTVVVGVREEGESRLTVS